MSRNRRFFWIWVVAAAIFHLGGSTASAVGWNGSEPIGYNPTTHDFLHQALYGRAYGTTYGANPWSTDMWHFDGAATRRVGFFGEPPASPGSPSHTSPNGYEKSGSDATLANIDIFHDEIFTPKIAESGMVAGWSTRYYGDGLEGSSAWVFHPSTSTTERVGYYAGHEPPGMEAGFSHEAADGTEHSDVTAVNGAGRVIGFSRYFSEGVFRGHTAWMYFDGGINRIGLFDHDCPDTLYDSDTPLFLNEKGQAAGNSRCGAWLFDGSDAVRIGLYDRDGTFHPAIYHSGAEVWGMNQDGAVIGSSGQQSDHAATNWIGGSTAWIHDGLTTKPIGLYSDEYIEKTNDWGFSTSEPSFISSDGKAAGWSRRRAHGGGSAWQYNGVATQRIGLFDEGAATETVFTHTSSTGEESSGPVAIGDGGSTIGESTRYRTDTAHGTSAWHFNGSTTTRIGFFSGQDPLAGGSVIHTRADGYELSRPLRINSSGAAIGTSERYKGSNYVGLSGWLYDPATGTTHMLVASQNWDGTSITKPQILTDAGEVYGAFRKYQDYADKGWHLFYWTLEGGFRDISEEAGGVLAEGLWTGWSTPVVASNVDKAGNIIGSGSQIPPSGGTNGVWTPFLVHAGEPAVPEITRLSPKSGPVGTEVAIQGTGFGATQGSSTVQFKRAPAAELLSWSDTEIRCKVPEGAKTGPVKVTTSGGTSNGRRFTVTHPPVVTSLTPASGPVGAKVTISGTGFGASPGSSVVKFKGVTASKIISWSRTKIKCKVPAGAKTGPVKVVTGEGASNGVRFKVTKPDSSLGSTDTDL